MIQTTYMDHSGKGNNGTLKCFSGQGNYIGQRTGFGKSLDFDGEGNYVSLGDLGDVEEGFGTGRKLPV